MSAAVIALSEWLASSRLVLRAPAPEDAAELRIVVCQNADHLRPWSPTPPPGAGSASSSSDLARAIGRQRSDWERGSAYVFHIRLAGERAPLIGKIALTAVTRGPFQSAQIGYWIDRGLSGRGYGTEAVRLVSAFAFERLLLHRVQAAVMPHNGASRRVLLKSGFREEGLAERYLCIDGNWEDHLIYALTVESWRERLGLPAVPDDAADC